MNSLMRRKFSRVAFPSTVVIVIVQVLCGGVYAATPGQVDSAVDKAVKHLYAIQKDGTWELDSNVNPADQLGPKGKHHGGLTAIAVYAMLAAGEKPRDPKMVRAMEFLKKLDTESIYVLGVRAQIWPYLGDNAEEKKLLQKDTELILKQMKSKAAARGLFYYPIGQPDQYDHSISQFAVLGLWTAVQNNIEVPLGAWDTMDQAWRAHQQKDGGWPYIVGRAGDEGQTSLSMTCAGVATLFITHDYVHAAKERACNGNVVDANIDHGLKWIADNFERLFKGGRDGSVAYYTLYGIERIGVAGGYKEFGKTNWFQTGSDFLIKHQNADGSFGGGGDIFGLNLGNIPDTAFALLFLAHGRAPAMINKLSYDDAPGVKPSWNQRPRDIANLVRWTGHQLESPLNWHIVPLSAPMADLHDAPILYLAGSKAVNFSEQDVAKLRQFVEEGGMLLANADCSNGEFSKSIEKLGSRMFHDYEFREVPMSHPIFVNQQFPAKKFRAPVTLRAQSNGVRELILLIPEGDPARTWQVPFQGNVEPYGLGTDIIEYATDRQGIQDRIPSPVIELNPKAPVTRSIKLARLSYAGNWNPEPGGWRRLSALLHNNFKVQLEVEDVKLGEGKLVGFKIAHLTGTAPFTFSDAQRQEIKAFTSGGGTLIVDAAGGSTLFADSAEKELAQIFGIKPGDALGNALPPNSPLFDQPGARIDKFRYRVFARSVSVGSMTAPHLIAIQEKGRAVAYYSREDLSGGLVGQEVDGIVGYAPETATEIMRNIVLSLAPAPLPPHADAPPKKNDL